MTEKKEEEVHVYDGIEEQDNSLPNWWLGLFYCTIVFALGYFLYYNLWGGPSLKKEYEREHEAYEYAAMQRDSQKSEMSDAELIAVVKDPARAKAGSAIFQSKCIACHGNHGQGGIGPNLTDDYWLHGGRLSEIAHTITNGVLDKGMPPWGPVLKEDEIKSLVAFIRSIHGSNPAGAKAPQGKLEKQED